MRAGYKARSGGVSPALFVLSRGGFPLRMSRSSALLLKPERESCGAEIVREHGSEAGYHDEACGPAERIGALALSGVHRLAVGHHPAQQEAGGQTSQVGSVVDPADNEAKDKNVDHPADQLAANHLHVRAPSARRGGAYMQMIRGQLIRDRKST